MLRVCDDGLGGINDELGRPSCSSSWQARPRPLHGLLQGDKTNKEDQRINNEDQRIKSLNAALARLQRSNQAL